MHATCLERVLNIFLPFQHCYLNAPTFTRSKGKKTFTSSQEQSGNLGCDVSHHLCAWSAFSLLFGSFTRPDSLVSCSSIILIDLC